MAVWFLVTTCDSGENSVRQETPYTVEGCRYPVYLVEEGLPSPCLFGLIRPAVYLTPAAVASPDRLRHVIAHETAHARHLDPLWSLLRCVCLAVYWFDPLVWAAAAVSRGGRGAGLRTRRPSGPWGRRSASPTARRCWP